MMNAAEAQKFRSDMAKRARKLARYSKQELAAAYAINHPGGWTAHPPETWNRDELVNDALRVDFPADSEAESIHVLYHAPGVVWDACGFCTAAQLAPALEMLADELAARVVEQVVWAGRTFGELSPDEKRRAAAAAGRQLSAELAANAENIGRVMDAEASR